jgi:hypothetical protein
MEKARHNRLTAPGSCKGMRMNPAMGRHPSASTYKGRPRPHKEAILVRRTLSPTRALTWSEEQLLANAPQLLIPPLWALRSSSPRLIKLILTHTGRRVLRPDSPNQYKSLCSSWYSHPLLRHSTICSILLAGGKKTPTLSTFFSTPMGCCLWAPTPRCLLDGQVVQVIFSLLL